jgi:plastocyanin
MYLWRCISLALVTSTIACGGYSAPTTPTGGGGGEMANPPPAGTVNVAIQDFSFLPATVTITAGTNVRWTNNGPSVHTTTSDNGTWSSPSLAAPTGGGGGGVGYSASSAMAGGTFDFTFTQPGTYSYHCSLHPPSAFPGFVGTITVNP